VKKLEKKNDVSRLYCMVQTMKLMFSAASMAVIIFHPWILYGMLLGYVEKGNVLQNIVILFLWLSDLILSAVLGFILKHMYES
jgi:hypothetical protein